MGNLKAKRMGEVSWYVVAGHHNGYRFSLPKKYGEMPIDRYYARFNGTLNEARAFCKKLIEDNQKRYRDSYDVYSDAVFYSPLDCCFIVKGMIVPKEDVKLLESIGEEVITAMVSRKEGGWVHTWNYSGPSIHEDYKYVLVDKKSGGIVKLRRWEDGKYEVRWVPNSQRGNSYRIAPNGSLMR